MGASDGGVYKLSTARAAVPGFSPVFGINNGGPRHPFAVPVLGGEDQRAVFHANAIAGSIK